MSRENRGEAERIIREHIIWSVGAGLVPVPLLDIAAVSAIQLDMLKQLATLYKVKYTESEGKVFLSAMTGSILAKLAANAIKFIPGIGSVIGGLSMSVLSGASTYALGQVAVNHFESNGTFSGIDFDKAKKAFEEHLEKGKEVAADLKDKKQGQSRDVFEKLEKSKELRDKGVISEDDFEAIKRKLLDEV
ncbi:MAG: DUF697 domain-containing protein [Polyangiaceae bacterium]